MARNQRMSPFSVGPAEWTAVSTTDGMSEDGASSEQPPVGRLEDFVTNYRIPKMVTIRSRWLRIPELILQGLILFYIVIYELVYKLSFMKKSPATAESNLQLLSPQANFWNCSEAANDCILMIPDPSNTALYPYCGAPSRPASMDGCGSFDTKDITPGGNANTLFVATVVGRIAQERCTGEFCQDIWTKTGRSFEEYVTGIEDFLIKIRHSFTSVKGTQDQKGTDVAGYFLYRGEDIPRSIQCYAQEGVVDDCKWVPSARWAGVRPCGTDYQNRTACFGTLSGDYVSVGMILDAAGIDLDGEDNVRYHGLTLELGIRYTNMDPRDFWLGRPVGPKFKYVIEPKPLKMASVGSGDFGAWEVRYSQELEPSQRTLSSKRGLVIATRIKGELGQIVLFHAALTISIALALFRIGQLVINHGLVTLYANFADAKHVKVMYDLWHEDVTPAEEVVQEHISGGNVHNIFAAEREHQQRRANKALGLDELEGL